MRELELEHGRPRLGRDEPQLLLDHRALVGDHPVGQARPDDEGGIDPELARDRTRHRVDAARGVDEHDDGGGVLDERPEALRLARRDLPTAALRQVAQRVDDEEPGLGLRGPTDELHQAPRPIRDPHPQLDRGSGLLLLHLLERGEHQRDILSVDQLERHATDPVLHVDPEEPGRGGVGVDEAHLLVEHHDGIGQGVVGPGVSAGPTRRWVLLVAHHFTR
jgi:hypothetical protein